MYFILLAADAQEMVPGLITLESDVADPDPVILVGYGSCSKNDSDSGIREDGMDSKHPDKKSISNLEL